MSSLEYMQQWHAKKGPAYRVWDAMKARCLNPDHRGHRRYGARGITVCERWLTFDNFLADMGQPPKGLTLDRIDNNGNYEPANCRWATWKQQAQNTSNTKISAADVRDIRNSAEPQSVIAKRYGICQQNVSFIRQHKTWRNIA